MLEQFTKSIIAIKEHKEKYPEVFAELENLERIRDEVAEQLKVWARENGDCENGIVKVSVAQKWLKWYDPADFNDVEMEILKANGAVKTEVNKKIADDLAKDETISRETLRKAYREEQGTSAVTIKLL